MPSSKGHRTGELLQAAHEGKVEALYGQLRLNALEKFSVKQLDDAEAYYLAQGQMTAAPVQTQFGWHVIRLEDERPSKTPSFEEVKPQLQQNLQRQAVDKVIGDLRAKAKID